MNPATEIGFNHSKSCDELENYFVPGQKFHSYFRDFHNVSEIVYNGLGREGGTAHTDIVKCGSKRFPSGKEGTELFARCSTYLQDQILKYKPKLLICNGSPVSNYIKKQFPANEDKSNTTTSYWTSVDGIDICVILSGFIGRIDNYARRRLGVEIEARLEESHSRNVAK